MNNEMVEGYADGFASKDEELGQGNNRSESYKHGWLNGRDDRLGKPRASASVIRENAKAISLKEQSYIP